MATKQTKILQELIRKMDLPPLVFGLKVIIASTNPVDTSQLDIGLSQAQMVAALEALARLPELDDQQRAGFASMAQEARDPQLPYPRPAGDGEEGGEPA